MQADLIAHADLFLTQDGSRTIIENGFIAVADGKILSMGKSSELDGGITAARELRLGRSLIMPGLVNAHTHLPMSVLRGFADDLPLMEWLTEHIFPAEAKLSPHILEVGTLLSCAEMISTGTTAMFDMYLNEPCIYRAIGSCGLKARIGEGIFAFPSLGYDDAANAFDTACAQADELKKHHRIKCSISPHSVYTTTPEILERCAVLSQERGLPLNIHLAETKTETEQCLASHGCRPVELCRRTGILGPRTTIAHGVDLNDEEIKLLANTGTVVAHNPRSNMKLASGAAPVARMLEHGVRVALGTDGAASNNMQNMFAEMSACALMHKLVNEDPTTLPAQTVLDTATRGGAFALHWPGLGKLSKGGPADFIALDLDSPNLLPMQDNPASHLVYACTGREVTLTVVDGEILYHDGKFTSLDYPALVEEVREVRAWMRRSLAK